MAYNMTDDDETHDDGPAFLEQSNFSYMIPSATNFKADTTSPPSLLEDISQRDVLFFGMRLASRTQTILSLYSCLDRR